MVVRPLRDDRYVVETDSGTYVVDVERRACTCPDHAIRGARCKHLRRVAIEIAEGEVPPPGRRTAVCAVCGGRTFVPVDDDGPHLCPAHDHAAGDVVADRETGKRLLVVRATGERADGAESDDGTVIADYPTNAAYGGHEPVFEAVYLGDLSRRGDGEFPKRYGFPASRLRTVARRGDGRGDGGRPAVRGDAADAAA
jgi:hypothetical protein